MAPRKKTSTKKRAPRRASAPAPANDAGPIRGLAPGAVIRGWKVFRLEDDAADEQLAPEKRALKQRYRALEVDVRRLSRAQTTRLRQLVAMAAAQWDDVDQKADTPEARRAAVETAAAAQEAVLEAYREALLTKAAKGGLEFGPLLVAVRPVVVADSNGREVRLEDLAPAEQVDHLDELGLLDSVGRAALEAQSTELQNLHL